LKTPQLILSLLGLVAIALAYWTGKLEFLIIALAAFVGGLYYMGAIGKRSTSREESKSQKNSGNTKDKSRNNQ